MKFTPVSLCLVIAFCIYAKAQNPNCHSMASQDSITPCGAPCIMEQTCSTAHSTLYIYCAPVWPDPSIACSCVSVQLQQQQGNAVTTYNGFCAPTDSCNCDNPVASPPVLGFVNSYNTTKLCYEGDYIAGTYSVPGGIGKIAGLLLGMTLLVASLFLKLCI